jgi:2-methylaconitate cis-trans-isomerase PrpF
MSIPATPVAQSKERLRTRQILPSVWMRAGTSKGLYIHRHHLPAQESEWEKILLAVMGSREGCPRQLDGIGGATSTTSKVAVVSKSSRPDTDVDFTFIQVAVGSEDVDLSGNCGNIISGVGPFALDEGLVTAEPDQKEVKAYFPSVEIHNANFLCLLRSIFGSTIPTPKSQS